MKTLCGCLFTTLAILICITYVVSFPVFYGMMAFGNHEEWDCYATQNWDEDKPYTGNIEEMPDDYHNVSANF